MLLQCEGVAVRQRLAPFSAEVAAGALIHIVGPNGAGKSTLLTTLAGLLAAEGTISLAGKPLREWQAAALARARAWLPQQQAPVGQMPVWHYLSLHHAGETDETTLETLCTVFQLAGKLARPVNQLSGGEWQRVRLAAVFCQIAQPEGRILLLDEPLTGLDLAQQAAFDRYLAACVAQGLTVIMSGHDINHSLHHARTVWLMKEGALVQQGEAKSVLQPETLSKLFGVPFHKLHAENHEILTTFL
ncbi:vitamin B12 ABC transporter ATP-binding protein BtuD [Erwinia pyri]|uniref:Vitamin B12 import ATP-binding protein BtuD n=1 Tax=Erwinia pyri TaxID=3062598 RepID=A0AA50HMS0_9GAMM|nr:vitamin B12 ABC transporter ATP-binding protein BtuD [Erwinia sp. DE2]WLS80628.1 vitamin B12 ABC transporter ATP-binding protein BtuD [Erwinia sp. DE2]